MWQKITIMKPLKTRKMKVDRIVIQVMNKFADRSEAGIKKYGTNLERKDLSTLEWINHAQEEAMDFVLYLERLKQEHEK
jgi:hypothetical protein